MLAICLPVFPVRGDGFFDEFVGVILHRGFHIVKRFLPDAGGVAKEQHFLHGGAVLEGIAADVGGIIAFEMDGLQIIASIEATGPNA